MTFSYTWDASYESEFDNDSYGYEIDDKLNKLINMIRERLEEDHEWKNGQEDGKHKKVTLREQSTTPSASANEGYIYSKESGGKAELFYKDEDSNETQITKAGKIFKDSIDVTAFILTLLDDSDAATARTTLGILLPRSYLSGLTIKNGTDSDHDIDISVGECHDNTNDIDIKLTSAITKQIDNTWAVGTDAGGLFTGSVAADAWYHVFAIRETGGDTIDVGFDTSVIAANIPSGYTAYRRIGSVYTDASSNITAFTQTNDDFMWDVAVEEFNSTVTSAAVLLSIQVPPGIKILAHLAARLTIKSGSNYLLLSDPDVSDILPSSTNFTLYSYCDSSSDIGSGAPADCITDISQQIRYRYSLADYHFSQGIIIRGYQDLRGKND